MLKYKEIFVFDKFGSLYNKKGPTEIYVNPSKFGGSLTMKFEIEGWPSYMSYTYFDKKFHIDFMGGLYENIDSYMFLDKYGDKIKLVYENPIQHFVSGVLVNQIDIVVLSIESNQAYIDITVDLSVDEITQINDGSRDSKHDLIQKYSINEKVFINMAYEQRDIVNNLYKKWFDKFKKYCLEYLKYEI